MNNEDILVGLLIFLAGILALETRISVAILEVLAGIVAGNLFHATSSHWIDNLSMFGLLGLMFFAGLETDVRLLRRVWRPSLAIGAASFGCPLLLVLATAHLLGLPGREALLLAVGLSTTSVALLYAIFRERALVLPEHGQLLLAAAMVVDVASIVALALLFEGITMLSLLLAALALLLTAHMPRLGRWLVERYSGNRIELKTRFILLVLLTMVLLAREASIHVSLFGFVLGVFFSDFVAEDPVLEAKLKSLIFGLMAPIFFFKAGLYVRLASFHWAMLPFIALLGLVAYAGKYFGTLACARRFLPPDVARLAALVFNVRLSFGIIAATFGLESGILRQEMFLTMILIVVGTSLATSLLLRFRPAATPAPAGETEP